jgi:hypothetical protein
MTAPLGWSQADVATILYDGNNNAWHAGIVKDILALRGGNVIVATDSGGIWSVGEEGTGVCLIDSDKPDMWCLAQGPDGDTHVFAGGETLFETDVSQVAPLLSWNEVSITDSDGNSVGTIQDIVVDIASRRIVVATAGGVYWATIPASSGSGGCAGCIPSLMGMGGNAPRAAYAWVAAKGLPPGNFCALAIGPRVGRQPGIAAAAWGADVKSGLYGIFRGSWDSSDNLVFQRAEIAGTDPTQMCYTALASCANFPARMYATTSNNSGNMLALLTSIDGGAHWTVVPGAIENDPKQETIYTFCTGQGNDGGRPCNALGAGPISPGLVALGWRSGPFISTNGGATFRYVTPTLDTDPGDGSKYSHIHGDYHAMHFDVNDQNGRLYIGSDGGIIRTDDLGDSFVSAFNQKLLNLQLLGTTGAREWYGSLGCSPTVPGLVGAGTQDNGNLFTVLNANPQSWTFLEGGDGRIMAFLANGALVHYFGDDDRAQLSVWDGTNLQGRGVIPYYQDRVLHSPAFERVESPSYRNAAGQLLYGVGATGSFVYGLYGDENGDNTRWSYLGSVPIGLDFVSAVSSRDGTVVFVGTYGARMFLINPWNDLPVELVNTAISKPSGDESFIVHRIVTIDGRSAFASCNRSDRSSGTVLRWDGDTWSPVVGDFPREFIYAMEADVTTDPPTIYAATDAKVYSSNNWGASWGDVSGGLPRRPHCSDLRYFQDETGSYLYLSTFGRSLWVAQLLANIRVRPQ